ncbi:Transducin/WD40 repeat-like superfamily protein [Thalictrum thalictroides]|uniref:Transducin/WD40 repeat-like superfamily protein n=1 Tax=Thalictrum thalictroides TaxID=46969 RepID=A0A7J6XGV1_THATH|nr:Transducin/WD40 repeat-like superfamily protein [Thalictrum thalictroides]
MVSPFQTATLVARSSYPNSIAWSDENLVAIASGHLITILNPALLFGPRGLITIPPIKPFPIGVVSREDLATECLLPTFLSRDTRPCARSIAWSPLGLAPNSGCILAVCTTEGRVKLYRQPFIDYCAEWVEVIDITDLLFDHLVRSGFGEADLPFTKACCEDAAECQRESGCGRHLKCSMLNQEHEQRMVNISRKNGTVEDQVSYDETMEDANGSCTPFNEKRVTASTETTTFHCLFKKNTCVEILKQNGAQLVWVKGMIERIRGAKALVQYSETEISGTLLNDEWVELNIKKGKMISSHAQNSINPDRGAPPKIRPYMDVGNLPEQIPLLEYPDLERILSGQAVEAWLDDRWVEGLCVGFSQQGLLVKLSGTI